MIKKEELGIGNTVEQGIVYELRNTVAKIKYNDRYSLIAYEDLNPIPLTEEILIDRGFEYSKFYDSYVINISDTYVVCIYLHELENLYYCLTKKNL